MTAIYLSPHHDDVCFSLGWTALNGPGGHLVNLCSRSNYTVRGPCAGHRPKGITRLLCGSTLVAGWISRRRAQEDAAFARRCRLARHDLGLADARLAGRSLWHWHDLDQEADTLASHLLEWLARLDGPRPDALYCPMGIGGHRDHVATAMAVVRRHAELGRHFRLFFYEELHYASDARKRTEGLARFRALVGHQAMRRHAVALTPGQFAEKLSLVALYTSQHASLPVPEAYMPAGSETPGPHEAFWELAA
ncbi:MAG: hypothetical protein HGA75_16770 [Thiobacillus sp.]|nr:hypothetical protein [Thiobacillus sp.]